MHLTDLVDHQIQVGAEIDRQKLETNGFGNGNPRSERDWDWMRNPRRWIWRLVEEKIQSIFSDGDEQIEIIYSKN